MKCKNIECENETQNKRVYCSLKCRNIYVNKYLRDYTKIKKTYIRKKSKLNEDYNNSPNLCKLCFTIIPFNKRFNTFCSNSCSAKHTNSNRIISDETKRKISITHKNLNIDGKTNIIKYTLSPHLCKNCDCILDYNNRKRKYCSNYCKIKYRQKDMKLISKYKAITNFKFGLSKYPDEYNFDLIRKHGWYSAANYGNNTNGVSRDHIYPVTKGFENKINPLLLAHPANCQLLRHNDNVSKGVSLNLTIEELLDKIEEFDNKYGKYYNEQIQTYIEYEEL